MDRHYHIRWSGREKLDYETFRTQEEAEASAEQLLRPNETYTIEERDESCPRCGAALNLKTAYAPENGPQNLKAKLKYPWQRAVLDAFVELRPQYLPGKINVAERAIAARLCDPVPSNSDEQRALREALANLCMIFPERVKRDLSRKTKVA